MRRLALLALVVWACSCGVQGRVPWWVAVQVAQAAKPTAAQARCLTYAEAWNAYVTRKEDPLRIIAVDARPNGEALSTCKFVIANIATGKAGCYLVPVDNSLRAWGRFKFIPNCKSWAARIKPVA